MIELRLRARKDFDQSGLSELAWDSFWQGYLAAIKRFGGKK